jgi:hypothetical protein
MSKTLTEVEYEKILLKEVKALPKEKLKEIIDFIEFLSLKEYIGFDKLVERTRKAAEKKGYKLEDVERLIEQVRRNKK